MRALERRLLRLEDRREVTAKPSMLFAMYGRTEREIIALACGVNSIQRDEGEGLDALLSRAVRELHSRLLWAIYVPRLEPLVTPAPLPAHRASRGPS